jgi:2-oxoglutarate dehydrogenase complex dehydrogenase (E1) component-like enzyme
MTIRARARPALMDVLKDIGAQADQRPDDFNIHRTIKRFLANRKRMIDSGEGIDWATAEALAFGSWPWKAIRSACPVRTASAAPSRSAIRCSTTSATKNASSR